MDRKYPGIEVTYEQAEQIIEKKKAAREKFSGEKRSYQKLKKYKKVIYKEVLNEEQYTLYETIEKEKKTAQEAKALVEIKKAYPVAEQLLEIFDEFTLAKLKVLRNKLESKIADDDKEVLDQLRELRKNSFNKIVDEELYPEYYDLEIENQELRRYAEFFVDLMEDNRESIVNLYPGEYLLLGEVNFGSTLQKYIPEIKKMEAELIYVTKETIKKGAVVVSEEYPIPPTSMILNEIKEVPEELMFVFLLLDPEVDFFFEMPNFENGEGQHFASAFPNPAQKNQTLEFYLQQDATVDVELLDQTGKILRTIVSENMNKGKQVINVNTQDLNPNIYFYRITNGSEITTLKFTVVR